MIVVLSVMDGFENELKKRLMSTDLHILITPGLGVENYNRGYVPIDTFESTEASRYLKNIPEVRGVWPIVETEAIIRSGQSVAGVEIKGVDAERLKRIQSQVVEVAEPHMLTQREGGETYQMASIFVGEELARMMGLIPGDVVSLISPTETDGPFGSVPRMKRFVVEGIYRSGLGEQERKVVFVQDRAAWSFLRKKSLVSRWEITLSEFERAPSLASELRSRAPRFEIQDWIQLNSNLFASLKLERIAMFIVLAFTVVVASFNIVTTLTLMVLEKKKEISILKAMGARRVEIASIFLGEGILIGGVGVGVGLLGGWILCFLLKRYQFIKLPDIYYDETLPVSFRMGYYVIVGLCAFVIVLLACVYPAKRASRLNPLDGIRMS